MWQIATRAVVNQRETSREKGVASARIVSGRTVASADFARRGRGPSQVDGGWILNLAGFSGKVRFVHTKQSSSENPQGNRKANGLSV